MIIDHSRGYIIRTSIITPNQPGRSAFTVTREVRTIPINSSNEFNPFSEVRGVDDIFEGMSRMFDHNLFLSNFFSSFRSSTNFQDILNRSFAEASVRKNPTSKEARANFAKVKITKDHCKIGKDGKNEEPSCTICISEIPINQQGIVLTCGHIFHPDCINPWLDDHNTCPTCRYEFPSENEGRRNPRQSRRPNRNNASS